MKSLFRLVIMTLGLVVFASTVSADTYFETENVVYFYIDGTPVSEEVEYEVTCYGYTTGIPGDEGHQEYLEPGTYEPEEVFSYEATCEEFGCTINEPYYLNYRHVDSCDLTAETGGETYALEDYSDTPIPPVEREMSDDFVLNFLAVFDLVDGMMLYRDVAQDHMNFEAVKYISEMGIVSGYPDGTYKPSNTLNRAELVKILVLSEYTQPEVNECDLDEYGFSDVSKDAWFAPYVCMAKSEGIISGYDDGTFRPETKVNFAEAAKIVLEVITVKDYSAESDEEWYEPYTDELEELDAVPESVSGYDAYITRGEMAEMIFKL